MGTASAVVAASLIVSPVTSYLVIRATQCHWRPYLKAIIIPLCASLIMGAAILILKTALTSLAGIPRLIVVVGAGGLVYCGMAYVFHRMFEYDLIRDFR